MKLINILYKVFLALIIAFSLIGLILYLAIFVLGGMWRIYFVIAAIWIMYFIIKSLMPFWEKFIDKIRGVEPEDDLSITRRLLENNKEEINLNEKK